MRRYFLYVGSFVGLIGLVIYPPQCVVHAAHSLGFRSSSYTQNLEALYKSVENEDWEKAVLYSQKGLQRHFLREKDLKEIALSSSVIKNSVDATKNILALPEKTGLSFSVAFPIVLFAQTCLTKEVEKGIHYWPEEKLGREMQFDSTTGRFFIHLGTNGVKKLGKGAIKVVTKTVLYDPVYPEVMARGVARSAMSRERLAMEKVRGLLCVQQVEAFMTHIDPKTKKEMHSLVTKLYSLGSLKNVLDKKGLKLSFKDRLQIACDIMTGLAQLHEKRIIHRDLGLKNYFLTIENEKPRVIRAIVADMGKSRPISEIKGEMAQGNSNFIAPEGLMRSKMKGEDYLGTDLFAVGCVLWRLYFGSSPQWIGAKLHNKYILKPKAGASCLIAAINKVRKEMRKKYPTESIQDRFISLILQLTDPDPVKRGTAKTLQPKFLALLHDVEHSKSIT